jgi:hypothetical protein
MRELHFHHVDRESKVLEISEMTRTSEYTLDDMKNEIKKCKIVCQKCHHIAHDIMHTRDDCIDALKYIAEKLDKSPSYSEYCENRRDTDPSKTTVVKKFGCWNDAKEAAGLSKITPGYTRDECITALEYIAEKLDKSPTFREYYENKRDTDPSTHAITNSFECWNDAKEAAGLKTVSKDISERETGIEPEPEPEAEAESGLVIEGQSKLGNF